MLTGYRNLLRGIATNWVGKIGVALTTSSFLLMLIFEALSLGGVLRNAYVGLVTYLTLPVFFVAGLVLIPIGWWLHLKRTGKTTSELMRERFDPTDIESRFAGSRIFAVTLALTGLNLAFLGGASGRMLQFMDQPTFCGTACHVMAPEWAAYQSSPHAHVDCVECHVGEGVGALVESKLSGMRQTLHFALGTYARPIPTPVHQLRPARETCQKCHFSELPQRNRVRTRVVHAFDQESTPRFTTLSLKLGAADGERGWIHWHASDTARIRFASTQGQRSEILWVESLQPDGSVRRFTNRRSRPAVEHSPPGESEREIRAMDCVDCHNRVAHVYHSPEQVLDTLLTSGELSRELPFAKQRGLDALTAGWGSPDEARRGIEAAIGRFYQIRHPEVAIQRADAIEQAIVALERAWARNVHPAMRVRWNTYPNHMGHPGPDRGCFRCHDRDMVDAAGESIGYDCTLCHSILAEDSATPFAFVTDTAEPRDAARAAWLRREFLDWTAASTSAPGSPASR